MLAPEQFHDWFQLNHESNRYKTRSNFNIDSGSIVKNLVIPYARTTIQVTLCCKASPMIYELQQLLQTE